MILLNFDASLLTIKVSSDFFEGSNEYFKYPIVFSVFHFKCK